MTVDVHIHDVLIIGAGPCSLALAARLCEPYPSALFTDSEHQKFHFLRRSQPSSHPSRSSTKKDTTNKPIRTSRRTNTSLDRLIPGPSVAPSCPSGLDIAVLDKSSDEWMGLWNGWFDKLNIEHLRSPMFFHTDPGDRDALRGFAWKENRERELKEIKGVVGRELSKWLRKKKIKGGKGKQAQEHTYLDERDRHDYFRPSQALFRAHCEEVAARYGLTDIVEKSEVLSVSHDSEANIFTLRTSTGVRKSRIVVLATGAGAPPSIPCDSPFHDLETHGSVKHVFSSPAQDILPQPLMQKINSGRRDTSLAIVGGGLTSAQLASLASEQGVGKIHLILRGKLKVKHFDVDLCWLAKFKNENMSRFWMADDEEEKWEIMRDARGGGSVNPEFRGVLRDLVGKGKVVLWEDTRICDGVVWDAVSQMWRLSLEGKIDGEDQESMGRGGIDVDAVVYATGSAVDFEAIKAIQPLLREYPIDKVAGLPCVTKELMWNEELPFFVTGRLGGLRLGPAAGNLEGARIGAELSAGRILGLLGSKSNIVRDENGHNGVDGRSMGLGIGNSFDVLSSCEDEVAESRDGNVRAML